jgi:hypothetical protein
MPVRRLFALAALLMVALIAGAGLLWLRPAEARPTDADFAAPLSARAAAESVAAAQAAEARLRAEARRKLGAIDPRRLPLTPTLYFSETGHHLSNRSGFLDFWRANGQQVNFGYPISDEIVEGGRVVQYFEQARFEYHPEALGTPHQVELGLLGREALAIQGMPGGIADPQSGGDYFPQTRHSLSGEFRAFWKKRGGLEAFGFPLSEPTDEGGRIVQYFERVKLEYHPEDMDSFFRSAEAANGFNLNTLFEVRVSPLGRQIAAARGVSTAPAAQLAGTAIWSPALWQRHVDVDLTAQWLSAYEDDLLVYRAPVATGRDGFNTPTGDFAIYYRLPMQDMTGSIGGETWFVPHIPWVQYIVGGVAFHGTYWHDAHGTGTRMSHGCVNLKIDDAQWLYNWADIGTTVHIHY